MDNLFSSGISIEKMAAFLDGNLSASEMQSISSFIDSDDSLQRFMDASSVVDESISAFSMSEIELPRELQSLDFELPNLDSGFSGLVTLSPEPVFEGIMIAGASADDPDVQFGTNEIGDSDTDAGPLINDIPDGHNSIGIDNDANSFDLDMGEL